MAAIPTMDNKFTVLMLVIFLFRPIYGSVLELKTSHSNLKPLLSTNMTIRCSLKDTAPSSQIVGKRSISGQDMAGGQVDHKAGASQDDDLVDRLAVSQTTDNMKFAISFLLSRDGVDLASITSFTPAKVATGLTGFEVSGQVNNGGNSGELGYLEIHWSHPSLSEAGTYKCEVSALSDAGHDVQFSQTSEVNAGDVTVPDLVNFIHELIIDKEIKDQLIAVQQKTAETLNKTVETLDKTVETLTQELNTLKSACALKSDFDALKAVARTEPDVFFSVGVSTQGSKSISSGATLIYDKIYANKGAAYSSGTGVFTAPVSGYYHFEIYATTSGSSDTRLRISVNGAETVEGFCYSDTYGACANSLTTHLTHGDTVKVVSRYGSNIYTEVTNHPANTFSGQILSAD